MFPVLPRWILACWFVCFPLLSPTPFVRAQKKTLVQQLRGVQTRVLPEEGKWGRMLYEDMRARRRKMNERDNKLWAGINTRAKWEAFRDGRLRALETSLGSFPAVPRDLQVQVTRTHKGEGYRIDNIVFVSRPGLVVTANLYQPAKAGKAMPGILICHSHHNPKTQGELQDMGILWARRGCVVLVMDQLGHGERRQHPFKSKDSFPASFRVSRQDYYFRYNVGIQLHTIGDSLMGWMVWDLRRGVDLLLSRSGVDPKKIILLGAVAGGGDPAAVTASLDRRTQAAVPFNFGGPQPETRYPLPPNAKLLFNYMGGGSWESTRNLQRSAKEGFAPWVIVGGIAPRRLIYAHEFAWDRKRDPVWDRLNRIYRFYKVPEHLTSVHGRGSVRGRPPTSTHCNNIGAVHRQAGIYAAFQRWFKIPIPEKEVRERRSSLDLHCLTPATIKKLKARPVYALASALGQQRAAQARKRLAKLSAEARRKQLRQDWQRLLGLEGVGGTRDILNVTVSRAPVAVSQGKEKLGAGHVERILLKVEPGIVVPLLLLVPEHKAGSKLSAVVVCTQSGKQAFLERRADQLALLMQKGVMSVLPDVRGTGETRPGSSRGRRSSATGLSSSELMLGQTLVGSRLRDLRAVLRYLLTRPDINTKRVALWGDSLAPVNPAGTRLAVPLGGPKRPTQAEPLGGLLALLGALFEKNICAVYVRGGLSGYQALLKSPFVYVPHDIVVPGALTAGDLCDVAAALAPHPLRLENLVDGHNQQVSTAELAQILKPTRSAYQAARAGKHLHIRSGTVPQDEGVRWLIQAIEP